MTSPFRPVWDRLNNGSAAFLRCDLQMEQQFLNELGLQMGAGLIKSCWCFLFIFLSIYSLCFVCALQKPGLPSRPSRLADVKLFESHLSLHLCNKQSHLLPIGLPKIGRSLLKLQVLILGTGEDITHARSRFQSCKRLRVRFLPRAGNSSLRTLQRLGWSDAGSCQCQLSQKWSEQ